MEIGLRFWLTEHPDKDWTLAIPFLQSALNNATNFATGFALNKLVYGFRVRDILGALNNLLPEDIERLRLIKRLEAEDMIAFATVLSKIRYDALYKQISFKAGDHTFLKLHYRYTLLGVANRKLSY